MDVSIKKEAHSYTLCITYSLTVQRKCPGYVLYLNLHMKQEQCKDKKGVRFVKAHSYTLYTITHLCATLESSSFSTEDIGAHRMPGISMVFLVSYHALLCNAHSSCDQQWQHSWHLRSGQFLELVHGHHWSVLVLLSARHHKAL
ncbi:hypothetical protein PGIGA_G00211820 [Pangasianodon gigas]|uniref:Uncharacterized protein n=1 Tax=Pangasianodon gigas TaxID=30993 RepID=A0ACC5WGB4_PANGG|nr:hypothetical protein [Pangasianodon gigas]